MILRLPQAFVLDLDLRERALLDLLLSFLLWERLWISSWIRRASSARTALGQSLILAQVVSGLIEEALECLLQFIYRHLQIRRPISQFLEIRSTSDSDGEGSLSIIAPLAFCPDAEGADKAYKETSAIFLRRGFDEDGFK